MAETIGSLADKIIIAELKIYHMQKQIERPDVNDAHRRLCRKRLKILRIQRNDLVKECSELYENVFRGMAQLKIYRQFKMYNDPRFRIGKSCG